MKKVKKAAPSVPVSRRAVEQRVSRALAKGNEFAILRRARTVRTRLDLGDYYAVDLRTNLLIDRHINLEPYARELGVLAEWEYLETEKGD